MALYRTDLFFRAAVAGRAAEGHYVTVLSQASDEASANSMASDPDLLRKLAAPGIWRDVEIELSDVGISETVCAEPEGARVLIAAADARCAVLDF